VGLYYYDKAFLEKLNKWKSDSQLQIVGPDESTRLFQMVADEHNDKPISLPLICLTRRAGFTINNTGKRALSFDGATKDATIEKSLQINAIPITIPYQLDVYTRYLREADEYARNIVFNVINSPKITVTIPYNGVNLEHDSNIRLASEVVDNSSIPERLVSGQFTRLTFSIEIDDAYLFDARLRDNYIIDAKIDY
jgi:hypothetical protein